MIKKTDYIIHDRSKMGDGVSGVKPGDKVLPMTEGGWQTEALDTLGMYAPNEGNFTPVNEQLTLFPMEPTGSISATKKLDLDDPKLPVPHREAFRWLAKDTLHQLRTPKLGALKHPAPTAPAKDAFSATRGEMIVDGITEMKPDQFPGRVDYTKGGLYPDGDKKDPKVIEQHHNAPNYRKMPDKPVHGVGQPTKQGFRDVLGHLGGKDKPVVWTNTRAEAIIYINGEPYNLRQIASMENLVLKEGATGSEVEALETELKKKLVAKGSIQVALEPPGPNGEKTKPLTLSEGNVQTTKDVIDELRSEGYKVEYKRIPMADEKSPTPAQIDATREWMDEMQTLHPKANLEYVFNCHQGRGRTTTGMVAAGIALDGQTKQLELPFGVKVGENAQGRADRIIDENFHMQNLRETVEETKKKAADQDKKAQQLDEQARLETDEKKKAKLEHDAEMAREKKTKYEQNATDFTKRYAMMQKYSEYIDKYGSHAKTPSFEEWMGDTAQIADLDKKWASINQQLGLITRPEMLSPGMTGQPEVALA